MRVGVVALMHESNTFIRGRTTLEHFQHDLWLRGNEVRRLASSHHEVGGFFAGLNAAAVESVPIFATRAVPFGVVETATFRHLRDTLHAELDRAGPLDGLLVAPHGAMVAEEEPDADGCWLTEVRQRYGPNFPIIGTLDLHANLSPRMITATDALIAYRTNPHLDQRHRGIEAATLMARTLRQEVRPTQGGAFPPVVINIERQHSGSDPCRSMFQILDQQLQRPWVLSNSILLGFPYADVPEMGASAIVVTESDRILAERYADELGEMLWQRREQFIGQLIDVEAALDQADQLPGPVCLLDMGDNVGGGSPGNSTILAHALHRRRFDRSFVCIYDPEAASRASSASRVRLTIGDPPLDVEVAVISLHDGRFEETEPRHGGMMQFDQGRTAVVRTDSGLTLMLASRRVPPFSLRQLTAFGIEPEKFQVLVAKGVQAPVAAYAPVCRHLLRVNTPGVTCADLNQLQFHHRRRPLFPFERNQK